MSDPGGSVRFDIATVREQTDRSPPRATVQLVDFGCTHNEPAAAIPSGHTLNEIMQAFPSLPDTIGKLGVDAGRGKRVFVR